MFGVWIGYGTGYGTKSVTFPDYQKVWLSTAAPSSRGNSGRARSLERPEVSLAAVASSCRGAKLSNHQVTRLTLQGAATTAAPSSRGTGTESQSKN